MVTGDDVAGGDDEGSQGPPGGRDDKHGVAQVMELDKYFKVKTIDGGKPGGSFCIRGVVFSNQVTFSEQLMRVRVRRCFDVTDSAARLFTRRWLAGYRPPRAIRG